MSVDYPDFMPASQQMLAAWLGVTTQIAGLIATGNAAGAPGGVPLLTLNNVLDKLSGKTLAPGVQYQSVPLTINQPSYDIWAQTSIPAGSTQPDLLLTLFWSDSTIGSSVMSEEHWYLPCTQNGVNTFGGRGLSKGDTLQVTLTNLDTTETMTLSYGISQHSRLVQRDDIRSVAFNGRGAAFPPQADSVAGVLCSEEPNVAAGGDFTAVMPLFSGRVRVCLTEAPAACRVFMRALALTDSPVPGLTSGFVYDSGAVAALGVINDTATLPRAVVQLDVHNAGAAAQTFAITVTQEDY